MVDLQNAVEREFTKQENKNALNFMMISLGSCSK